MTTRTAICFEHKTQYLLIRAPYTRIMVFWHISNIPPMISQIQISCNTPTFYKATIFVKYCYTTAVGCYNSWANVRCSGCYTLGEKLLWNRSISIRDWQAFCIFIPLLKSKLFVINSLRLYLPQNIHFQVRIVNLSNRSRFMKILYFEFLHFLWSIF